MMAEEEGGVHYCINLEQIPYKEIIQCQLNSIFVTKKSEGIGNTGKMQTVTPQKNDDIQKMISYQSTKKEKRGNKIQRYKSTISIIVIILFPGLIFSQLSSEDQENAFYRQEGYMLISGEQYGDYPAHIYLVTEDVIVDTGQTLVFYPGTIVLFKKNTGIIVKGSFICQGNDQGTVILKKLDNDKYFHPLKPHMPTWWNGINVAPNAQVELSHTRISESKFGIEADAEVKAILLDSVVFKENRYYNMKIGDSITVLPDDQCISFNSELQSSVIIDNKEVKLITKRDRGHWKIPVGIVLGSTVVIGASVAAYFHNQALVYHNKAKSDTDSATFEYHVDLQKDKELKRNISMVIASIGAVGLIITIPLGRE